MYYFRYNIKQTKFPNAESEKRLKYIALETRCR